MISYESYKKLYDYSLANPIEFWRDIAKKYLIWQQDFEQIYSGDIFNFENAEDKLNQKWFVNGKLNACYNCLDRHLPDKANQIAYYWQGDELEHVQAITYGDLYSKACIFSNVLLKLAIKPGDRVCIYLPVSIEAVVAMLACARIAAIHNVVFVGFSPKALAERIIDSECNLLITTDSYTRGGKRINILEVLADNNFADNFENNLNILLVENYYSNLSDPRSKCSTLGWDDKTRDFGKGSDNNNIKFINYKQIAESVSKLCEPVFVDSDEPLFILYTSGSTGKPKGVLHSTAGYLLHAVYSFNVIFDIDNTTIDNNIYWCTADIGWITGHSYLVYGPLVNGITSVIFSGTPNHPDYSINWQIVDKYKVNIFYTAPTAIRALMKEGEKYLVNSSRQSLRLLGSVGEPINPQAWQWYYKYVGNERCPIIDTWWQTETGAVMIAPIADFNMNKPGCAMLPFYGINIALLDDNKKIISGQGQGNLVIKSPWPGMIKTVYKQPKRFIDTYFKPYSNYFYTGDLARRDQDGHYWLLGRFDDVINIAGHRLGTAEIESALVSHEAVAEAAVVPIPDDIKGQGLYAFVTLKSSYKNKNNNDFEKILIQHVKKTIGAIAVIKTIKFTDSLPKTRSGKIMRRILKQIAIGENNNFGDLSTLADQNVINKLL